MSANMGRAVIAIEAIDYTKGVLGDLQANLSQAAGLIGELGGGFEGIGRVMQGFASGGVAGAAIGAISEAIRGLQDSLKAAKESEEVWGRLAFMVEKSGQSWAAVRAEVQAFAAELQRTTRFGDEETAKALQRLMTFGMDLKTAMETVQTAMDLAAAKQMDLVSACDLLGKAFIGHTTALTRYGIVLEEGIPKGERFGAVIQKLNEQFGGAAQRDIETYAGRQAQVANALGDLKEKIGTALLPVMEGWAKIQEGMIRGADDLINALQKYWEWTSKLPEPLKALLNPIQTLIDAFKTLWEAIERVASMPEVQEALREVQQALAEIGKALGGVSGEAKGMGDSVGPLAELIKNVVVPALKGFADILRGIADAIKTLKEVWGFFDNMIKGITSITSEGWKRIQDMFSAGAQGVQSTTEGLYQNLVGMSIWPEMWDEMVRVGQEGMTRIATVIDAIFTSIEANIASHAAVILRIMKELAEAMAARFEAMKAMTTEAAALIRGELNSIAITAESTANRVVSALEYMKAAILGARAFSATYGAGIAALQEGGIVTRPTVALLGERGPEAVIPLREMPEREGRREVQRIDMPVSITIGQVNAGEWQEVNELLRVMQRGLADALKARGF